MLLPILIALSLAAGPSEAQTSGVREAANAAGYAAIAERLEATSRATVLLQARQRPMPAALGTSRLGGDPDLPFGASWPRCKGRPQSFLGQVRLRDLPAGGRELRRHGGVLLFFTHVEFEPGVTEHGLWAGDCSRVIHARAGTELRRVASPRRVMELRPARLQFAARPDVPDLALDSDHLMPPLQDVIVSDWEQWFEFRYGLTGRPKREHRLLGYPDAPNGGNDCSDRAERPRGTWRHLFMFGPDDDLGFEVADAGRLQLLISPTDLRAGRFDRVCGTFDSG